MNNLITDNKLYLDALFKKNKVEQVFVFGSILNSSFNEASDIDFIINFKKNLTPIEKGNLWWNLHDELKSFLKKDIDIISEDKIKNPYLLKEINLNKKLIYG